MFLGDLNILPKIQPSPTPRKMCTKQALQEQKKNSKPKVFIEEMSKASIISVKSKQGNKMFRMSLLMASDEDLLRIYVGFTSSLVAMIPAKTMMMTMSVPSIATKAESLTMDIIEQYVRGLWDWCRINFGGSSEFWLGILQHKPMGNSLTAFYGESGDQL